MIFCTQRSSEKSNMADYKGIFVFILYTDHMTKHAFYI